MEDNAMVMWLEDDGFQVTPIGTYKGRPNFLVTKVITEDLDELGSIRYSYYDGFFAEFEDEKILSDFLLDVGVTVSGRSIRHLNGKETDDYELEYDYTDEDYTYRVILDLASTTFNSTGVYVRYNDEVSDYRIKGELILSVELTIEQFPVDENIIEQ